MELPCSPQPKVQSCHETVDYIFMNTKNRTTFSSEIFFNIGENHTSYTETIHVLCWPRLVEQSDWNIRNHEHSMHVRKHVEYISSYTVMHYESHVAVMLPNVKHTSTIYTQISPFYSLLEKYHKLEIKLPFRQYIHTKREEVETDETLCDKQDPCEENRNDKHKDLVKELRQLSPFDCKNQEQLSPFEDRVQDYEIDSLDVVDSPLAFSTPVTQKKNMRDIRVYDEDVFFMPMSPREDDTVIPTHLIDCADLTWGSFYEMNSESTNTSDEVTVHEPPKNDDVFRTEVLILPRKKGKFCNKKEKYAGILSKRK